jgi:uncharacterized membrane protein
MKRSIAFVLVAIPLAAAIVAVFFAWEGHGFTTYVSEQAKTAMNIPINRKAPVKSNGTIEISAPVDTVWRILTEIEDWPQWQKNVTESKPDGRIGEGASFKWKAGGVSFVSKIHTMKPKTMFGWTGRTFGADAIHNWTFENVNGATKVFVEESLQGALPVLLKGYFQKSLDAGVQANLKELKFAAESKERKSRQ